MSSTSEYVYAPYTSRSAFITMSVQLRGCNSTLIVVGASNFTMEQVRLIYSLYADDKLSLWEIKERNFNDYQIEELACAITHGQLDIQQVPYHERPRFSYDPSSIELSEFRVGNPSQ